MKKINFLRYFNVKSNLGLLLLLPLFTMSCKDKSPADPPAEEFEIGRAHV